MAEEAERIRIDSAVREVKKNKEVQDWGGKRVILPKGTTLPPVGIDGEVFVLVVEAGLNKLMQFDEFVNNWVTVGPA